jgi:hypothetical protein
MKNGTKIALIVTGVLAALALAAFGGAKLADDGEDDEPSVALTGAAGVESPDTAQAVDDGASDDLAPGDSVVEPDDRPLSRAEAARAGEAAAKGVAGATVVDVDRSDDPGEAYEVELTTDQGEIDVALDADFARVRNAAYDD